MKHDDNGRVHLTSIYFTDGRVVTFGPGWPQMPPDSASAPDLLELPLSEAVELLLKHWNPSVQVMLDKLKAKGVVLARRKP